MIDEHSGIRELKHRWDEEDKTRYELERQAQRAFLEQEANELFAHLENYLTRLDKVLHQANAAVEIDPTWEHKALPVYPRHRSTHSRYNLGRRAIYYRARSGYYSRASRFN